MATAEEGVDVERARLAVDRHVDLKPPLGVGLEGGLVALARGRRGPRAADAHGVSRRLCQSPWRVGSRHRGWGGGWDPRRLLNVVRCPGGGLTGSGGRKAHLIEGSA